MIECLLMAYLWDSMVMEWNINGMSMGFNSDILEYSWDIDGDIGKNITGDIILITLQKTNSLLRNHGPLSFMMFRLKNM